MAIEKIVIGIVSIGIILAFAAMVFSNMQETQVTNSTAYNVAGKGVDITVSFSKFMPAIVIIGIAAIILGVVFWIISIANKGKVAI